MPAGVGSNARGEGEALGYTSSTRDMLSAYDYGAGEGEGKSNSEGEHGSEGQGRGRG